MFRFWRFSAFILESYIGLGIDFVREDLNEYRWWQFEVRITIIKLCIIVRFHPYV